MGMLQDPENDIISCTTYLTSFEEWCVYGVRTHGKEGLPAGHYQVYCLPAATRDNGFCLGRLTLITTYPQAKLSRVVIALDLL